MKRREAREKAVQTLFQLDNTTMELSVDEAIHYITERPVNPFYDQLVRGTVQHKTEIDAALMERLENWSLERLPKIERTVLRLAVYELLLPTMPRTGSFSMKRLNYARHSGMKSPDVL